MSTCPECGKFMHVMDEGCSHCGFRYPPSAPQADSEKRQEDFEDVVLWSAAVLTALGIAATVLFVLTSFLTGHPFGSLLLLALAVPGLIIQYALVIVFLRAIKNRK